jgi:tripartite-type tricarboxylate transporter receptor subunit TctC
MKRSTFLKSMALASLAPAAALAQQGWPERTVRIIVPYAAGGNFDAIARLLAKHLGERWGKSVIIDNKAGANGNVGTAELTRAAPDGYTLGLVSNGTLAINPALYKSMPFDPVKDLTPISIVTSNPMVLVVNNSLPVRTIQDFIAYVRANPGKVNLANGGNGTLSHLSAEMLKNRTHTDIVLVPYKGTSLALTGLLGGQVQGMFDTIGTSIPLIDAGKVRALAVTGPKRFAQKPDLPTVDEAGVKDYSAEAKAGLVGPPGLPRALAEHIQKEMAAVLKKPEVRQRLTAMGVEPSGTTPDEFAADLKHELQVWSEIVRSSGAKLE